MELSELIAAGLLTEQQEDATEQNTQIEDISLEIPSVSFAQAALQDEDVAIIISKKSQYQTKVANWISENAESVAGGAGDWHNLISVLIKQENPSAAKQLVQIARKRYPAHSYLLADALVICSELAAWDEGDKLVELAKSPDFRAVESWYLPVHLAGYLANKAKSQMKKERDKTYEEALNYLKDASERLPPLDQIINQQAEILIEANRLDEARDLLENAIFKNDYSQGVRNSERIPVAQCCLTYIEKILNDSCDYEKIVEIAEAGIRFSATNQETVATDCFFYRKALALDAMLTTKDDKGNIKINSNPDMAREALQTYALAYKLASEPYRAKTCKDRFLILKVLGNLEDVGDISTYCMSNMAEQSA